MDKRGLYKREEKINYKLILLLFILALIFFSFFYFSYFPLTLSAKNFFSLEEQINNLDQVKRIGFFLYKDFFSLLILTYILVVALLGSMLLLNDLTEKKIIKENEEERKEKEQKSLAFSNSSL